MQREEAIYRLMERFSKGSSKYFEVELVLRAEKEEEWFKILPHGDKYKIVANTVNGGCSAFGYFIKQVLGIEIEAYYGKELPQVSWPKLEGAIEKNTAYTYRYNLNYCTFSYSMAFWKFEQWEKEMDQMAMHGINMMLNIVGQEAVYRLLLLELGYTEEEVGSFICGPAYFAWFFMENMSGWGGPLPLNWYDKQVQLGREMNSRLHELGMEPIFPGYSGMIPHDFEERFKAEVIRKGIWCGFESPHILLPQEEIFKKVANLYYKHQKTLFGEQVKFFNMDLFHECGAPAHVNLSESAKIVQHTLEENMPGSCWIMQGWGGNPKQGVLDRLDHSKVIILDLWGESDPRYKETNEFEHTPWIWCIINNFGGKQGLFGNLKNVLNKGAQIARDTKLQYFKGIGIAPEGTGTNPIIYQALLDRIWETDLIDEEVWLKSYIKRRYGQVTSKTLEGWKLLLESVYHCESKQQGACESIICARPGKGIKNVTTWGPDTYYYSFEKVREALKLFMEDYEKLKDHEGYLYDLVDVARQVLADQAREYYEALEKDLHNKTLRAAFLDCIETQDNLLSTRPEFLLGNWIKLARDKASHKEEEAWLEFNARRLITLWANEEGSKLLRDYACREWAGLTKDFYYRRWQTYFEAVDEGREELIDWYTLEDAWTKERTTFEIVPKGDIYEIIYSLILQE